MHRIYAADCLGLLTRYFYGNNDFKLFSEIVFEDGNTETAQDIKEKILKRLMS